MGYLENKNLIKTVFRMPKDQTSFFYFTLESNENLAFYSTLPFEKGQAYRDVVVNCTTELEPYLLKITDHLIAKREGIEILSREVIQDESL